MTLIVGIVGKDGAVMAADSEATESGHSRFDAEKIWEEHGLLFGYSGYTGVKQSAFKTIQDVLVPQLVQNPGMDRWAVRDQLVVVMKAVLNSAYQNYVGTNFQQIGGTLLVAGRDSEGDWLLEIDQNNNATFYNDRAFQAIGSGSAAAYTVKALLENYQLDAHSVKHLKVVAYRILCTCISTLPGSAGVGGEVAVWSSEGGGAFTKASQEELAQIENAVGEWETIERETAAKLFSEDEPTVPDEDVKLPEAIKPQETKSSGS